MIWLCRAGNQKATYLTPFQGHFQNFSKGKNLFTGIVSKNTPCLVGCKLPFPNDFVQIFMVIPQTRRNSNQIFQFQYQKADMVLTAKCYSF